MTSTSGNTLSNAPEEAHGWFAIFTSTRHEKRVAEMLAQREIEAFLPLYKTVHRWKNRCNVELELPLFPNYLFVRIRWRERVRVLNVPGVCTLLGSAQQPLALPAHDIDALREGLRQRKIEPHPHLIVGERARIIRGAMEGMEGVLLRKKNNFRVVLTIAEIAKSFAVELDAEDLEPVHSWVRHARPA